MPPGRKPSASQEEFVQAAITFADERGLDALTVRALGAAMGFSATAIYRYFPTKETLLSLMREELLTPILAGAGEVVDPRSRLRAAALSYRRLALEHPCLSQLTLVGDLDGSVASAIPDFLGGALAEMGLTGIDLVRGYRQLESFVVGTTLFDFSGAPDHLRTRLVRLRQSTLPEFGEHVDGTDSVEAVNESAFEASLDALLDALASEGSPEP